MTLSKASKRRRRRARTARHGHSRGRGRESRVVQLVGPDVSSPADAVMRLLGYRRVRGKHGDNGGEFAWAPPCECSDQTRNKRAVPQACPREDGVGHAGGTLWERLKGWWK